MTEEMDLIERMNEALSGTLLSDSEKADLIAAVLTRRPVLIIGPRGVDKEEVATGIMRVLDIQYTTVNCSGNLRRADLFGDVDPLAVKKYGYSDDRSYIPGVLEKADGEGILLRDLDKISPKLAQEFADFLDEGKVRLPHRETKVGLTVIAMATSSDIEPKLLDRFQTVEVSYPQDQGQEREYIAARSSIRGELPGFIPGIASKFLKRSRSHPDLEEGASTRAGIRFVENLSSCKELSGREPTESDFYNSCYSSFSHSVKLNPFSWKTPKEVSRNILQDVFRDSMEEGERGSPKRGRLSRYRIPILAVCLVSVFGLVAFTMMANVGPVPDLEPNNTGDLPEYLTNTTPEEAGQFDDIEVPEDVLEEISRQTNLGSGTGLNTTFDNGTDRLYITGPNGTYVFERYTEYLNTTYDREPGPPTPDAETPSIFDNISPLLLVAAFSAIAFLSTFVFDYLDLGGWIRDSRLMSGLRERFGIRWEPLTRLYRNISEEASSLSGRLEGESLGNAVKEISTARDELHAEKGGKASLEDIAGIAMREKDRFPTLASVLGDSEGGSSEPQKELLDSLQRHLEREGLVRKSNEGLDFTHRVSKFLMSDVDDRILSRVNAALRGVSYEELPPLPSSDVKDVKKYRRGDSYKDIAIRETIRDAIKSGRDHVERDNLYVYEREPERMETVARSDVDVVVVLDLSGSMAYGDKLWYAKQAIVVMTIIAERYGVRVGVVGFRDLSTEVTDLGEPRNTTIAEVANLLPRGGTNIAAGIRRSIDLLVGDIDVGKGAPPAPESLPERRKQVILLTDGDATHPKPKQFASEYARRCAKLAARYGIKISVICIGGEGDRGKGTYSYNPTLAREITEIGDGRLFLVKDMKDLSPVFVSEIDALMIGSRVRETGADGSEGAEAGVSA